MTFVDFLKRLMIPLGTFPNYPISGMLTFKGATYMLEVRLSEDQVKLAISGYLVKEMGLSSAPVYGIDLHRRSSKSEDLGSVTVHLDL